VESTTGNSQIDDGFSRLTVAGNKRKGAVAMQEMMAKERRARTRLCQDKNEGKNAV